MKAMFTVSNIMTKEVITASITDSISNVRQLLQEHKIRHIPVMDAAKIVGMITKFDFTRLTSGTFYATQQDADTAMMEMFTLEDIMVKNPVVISPNTSIKEAAAIFIEQDFHALPVVDNGVLVGILSTTDLLQYLSNSL